MSHTTLFSQEAIGEALDFIDTHNAFDRSIKYLDDSLQINWMSHARTVEEKTQEKAQRDSLTAEKTRLVAKKSKIPPLEGEALLALRFMRLVLNWCPLQDCVVNMWLRRNGFDEVQFDYGFDKHLTDTPYPDNCIIS